MLNAIRPTLISSTISIGLNAIDAIRGRAWDGAQPIVDPISTNIMWKLQECEFCNNNIGDNNNNNINNNNQQQNTTPIFNTLHHMIIECPGNEELRKLAFIKWKELLNKNDISLKDIFSRVP